MSAATPFPKSTPTALKERLSKQKEIERLEAKDIEKINRILRTIMEKGGSVTPPDLHELVCGSTRPTKKYPRLPKSKSDKKRISPRYYYGYLAWLKQNAYVTQEKRQHIILSKKGRDYWRIGDIYEAIKKLETPEKIFAKIMEIAVFLRQDYARKAENIVLSILGPLLKEYGEEVKRIVAESMKPLEE